MSHGFQFTPYGITALGDASASTAEMVPASAIVEAEVDRDADEDEEPRFQVPRKPLTVRRAESTPRLDPALTPGLVIKSAKARVKQIRAELRVKRALEKELAQLERLLLAARRPVAAVSNINSRRAG